MKPNFLYLDEKNLHCFFTKTRKNHDHFGRVHFSKLRTENKSEIQIKKIKNQN